MKSKLGNVIKKIANVVTLGPAGALAAGGLKMGIKKILKSKKKESKPDLGKAIKKSVPGDGVDMVPNSAGKVGPVDWSKWK